MGPGIDCGAIGQRTIAGELSRAVCGVRVDVVTLFPEIIEHALRFSIMARAKESGAARFGVHNPREWTTDRHRIVDDAPYGGGAGMVLKPEPLVACIEEVVAEPDAAVVLMTPQGETLTQSHVSRLAGLRQMVVLCGHYEGVDERVRELLVTDEISIGDYVLTGGELPALVLVDAVVRLLPGVLGNQESAREDSFEDGLLEHPHYTRPPRFRGMAVPEELVKGDHAAVARWRRKMSLSRTLRRRPDLIGRARLNADDRELLNEIAEESSITEPDTGANSRCE